MSGPRLTIAGAGAVTPAGWGIAALKRAMESGLPVPAEPLAHPSGGGFPARAVRRVPAPPVPSPFPVHGRLRRCSAVTRFAAGAVVEAMAGEQAATGPRTGLIFSLLNGCVNYSARFYGEVLQDPATASPLLFPETVFNAPASHLAVLLGCDGPVTTLVGDSANYAVALETAAGWLLDETVDRCLVVGAEEADWLTSEALDILEPGAILSEGAAALLLERDGPGPLLESIGPPDVSAQPAGCLLIDDGRGEERARHGINWAGPRWLPQAILGTAPGASAAIGAVLAVMAVRSGEWRRAVSLCTAPGGATAVSIHGREA